MTKKHLIIATAIAGFGTLGIAGLASASSITKPAPLAQEIAQKFNLKQSDVQAVIDQHHGEARGYWTQQHEQQYEARLNAEVKAGKLTSAQKDQILAKHKELVSFMDSIKGKSNDERRTAMKQKFAEVQQWAKDNKIDPKYLGFGFSGNHGNRNSDEMQGADHGFKHGMNRDGNASNDSQD